MTRSSLPLGTLVSVKRTNGTYVAILPDGTDVTSDFENYVLRNCVNNSGVIKLAQTASRAYQWRKSTQGEFLNQQRSLLTTVNTSVGDSIKSFIAGTPAIRPDWYRMSDLKWRFAIRAVLRGKNLMVTGPKGTGKTMLSFALQEALDRPLYNIPLGATQDPRSTLIGNTHYRNGPDGGTFVAMSYFVQAIQVPNAIVLLDELTRAHPDAWNLLMSVLDYKQRFLRVDESPDTPTIRVAEGVTFIATANIGSQYTATRALDAALLDRFLVIDIDELELDDELSLLIASHPAVDVATLRALAGIAHETRQNTHSDRPTLSTAISTRMTMEAADLCEDGFSLVNATELTFFSLYSSDGGASSERTFIKQLIQKHLPTSEDNTESPFTLQFSPGKSV